MKQFLEKTNTSVTARVVWCVMFAIPVPLSLLSIIASLLSLSMLMGDWSTVEGLLRGASALGFMVLAATYWLTYLVAVILVLVRKRIGLPGLFPILHILLFLLFAVVNALVG